MSKATEQAKSKAGAEAKETSKAGVAIRAKGAAISEHTKLPVDHPESQAVERIRYEMQQSLCGHPMTEAEIEALTSKSKR